MKPTNEQILKAQQSSISEGKGIAAHEIKERPIVLPLTGTLTLGNREVPTIEYTGYLLTDEWGFLSFATTLTDEINNGDYIIVRLSDLKTLNGGGEWVDIKKIN